MDYHSMPSQDPALASFADDIMESGHEEQIDNTERGCGHLNHNASYVRSDLNKFGSPDGALPAFVTLDTPIEYREHGGRGAILPGWQHFPGVKFALGYHNEGYETTPTNAIEQHQERLQKLEFDGDHYGDITVAHSQDLLMSVGASNWETPAEYIEETRDLGLNLKIPSSPNTDPPVINPFYTRCWVVHPNGVEEGRAGIIGYAILTRCIFTTGEDATANDPDIPKYAKEWAETGKVHLATPGPEISGEDGKAQPGIGDFADDYDSDHDPFKRAEKRGAYQTGPNPIADDDTKPESDDADEDADDTSNQSASTVVPSDKPGRDVEEGDPEDASDDQPLSDRERFWEQYDIPIEFNTAQNNRIGELQRGSSGTGVTESTARHFYVLEPFSDGRLSRDADTFLCLGAGDRPDRPSEPSTNPNEITCETCLKRMERWLVEGNDD